MLYLILQIDKYFNIVVIFRSFDYFSKHFYESSKWNIDLSRWREKGSNLNIIVQI